MNSCKKNCSCNCCKPCGVVPVSRALKAVDASQVSPAPPALPSGIIVMWSGSISDIPKGWVLCDGTNGTPDLRDRFVMGAVSDLEIGEMGGSNSIVLSVSQLPPHSHDGLTNDDGIHSHSYSAATYTTEGIALPSDAVRSYAFDNNVLETTKNGDHHHSFNTNNTGDGEPINITNSYYKLAFIMNL
ncbi:hypothetical protein [Lysinibacillus sp. TE18511]